MSTAFLELSTRRDIPLPFSTAKWQLMTFCQIHYGEIYESLSRYQNGIQELYQTRGFLPIGVTVEAMSDAHALPSCRRAIHAVEDHQLSPFAAKRTGGVVYIQTSARKLIAWDIHYYFTSIADTQLVADPTIGQMAFPMNTSLDQWIYRYPELFYKRILIGEKQDIANKLGIHYPHVNRSFEEIFSSNTNDIIAQQQKDQK